jgi:hypothetical protein
LALGAQTRIRVGPDSSVQVRSVDEEGVRLELENGALQATVRPGSGALRVGSQGREILATMAEFEMGVGPDGILAVEATQGNLLASGITNVAQIQEGARATVSASGEASIKPISEELLLAVDWPSDHRTRLDHQQVSGQTEPGAHVRLERGDTIIELVADARGRFEADVPLWEGENPLRVQVVDVLGHAIVADYTLTRDTRGPTFRGGVEYNTPNDREVVGKGH